MTRLTPSSSTSGLWFKFAPLWLPASFIVASISTHIVVLFSWVEILQSHIVYTFTKNHVCPYSFTQPGWHLVILLASMDQVRCFQKDLKASEMLQNQMYKGALSFAQLCEFVSGQTVPTDFIIMYLLTPLRANCWTVNIYCHKSPSKYTGLSF